MYLNIYAFTFFYLKDAFQRNTHCRVDSAIFSNNKIQYEKIELK